MQLQFTKINDQFNTNNNIPTVCKAVKRSTTSIYNRNPELPREGSNQGLLTGTSDEKLAKSNDREQDHLPPGPGKTDPVGPTIRNDRNAQQYPFPPKGPIGKKKLRDSTESEQDYLFPGPGETEPVGPNIRNYRNARSPPFPPGGPPAGKKKLVDSTERGAGEANLAELTIRNQRNARPLPLPPAIPNRKNSIESTERDQDGPLSDVQLAETAKQNPLPPGIPNKKDYTEKNQNPLPPGPQLGGSTQSQRETG